MKLLDLGIIIGPVWHGEHRIMDYDAGASQSIVARNNLR